MRMIPAVAAALVALAAADPAPARPGGSPPASRAWVDHIGRVTVARHERVLGVTVVTDDRPRAPWTALERMPPRIVLLVHGLDDPGWTFDQLIEQLRKAGHEVARFEYGPEDSVRDAADRLATALRGLRESGLERVDLVAHSMGGLIGRDLLTRAEHYGGNGAGSRQLPAVDRLIMVGTPNHGAEVARLRGARRYLEQLAQAMADDGPWPREMELEPSDPAADLVPGSSLLQELNGRPLPAHTRLTIIAGRWTPLKGRRLQRWARRAAGALPRWAERLAGEEIGVPLEMASLATAMLSGTGDGLVTLESARLEDVEDVVVLPADHLGLLADLVPSHRPPPAVPVILERLGEPGPFVDDGG